eukprot:14009371-Alexandrium_andersonii.AAC.1
MGRHWRSPGEEFLREAQAGLYKGPQYPMVTPQGWEVPLLAVTSDPTTCIRSTHPWALPTQKSLP